MKTIKEQLQSLQNTAFHLSLSKNNAFHAEIGVRGNLVQKQDIEALAASYGLDVSALTPEIRLMLSKSRYDFVSPQHNNAINELFRQLLGEKGSKIIKQPFRASSFDFCAAEGVSQEQAQKGQEDNICLSYISGSPEELKLLGQLIAVPATNYIHFQYGSCDGRRDSLVDWDYALGEWVYAILKIGQRFDDPNLKRFYRILLPYITKDDKSEITFLSAGEKRITEADWEDRNDWKFLLEAANSHQIGYSLLGTNLFLASRIALDHLISDDFPNLATEIGYQLSKITKGSNLDFKDPFEWARMEDVAKGMKIQLGREDALSKATISRRCKENAFASRKTNKQVEINLDSFEAWMRSQTKWPETDIEFTITEIIKISRKRMKQKT